MNDDCVAEDVVRTSVLPPGEKTKAIETDKTGLRITMGWKGWGTVVLILLTGGGGVAGFSLVTDSDLDQRIAASEKKQLDRVEDVKSEVGKNRKSIDLLTVTVKSVQEVQHVDVAHREARRVVEEQLDCNMNQKACRAKRTEKIERLRRINMKRLKEGRETCDLLDCSD